MRQNIGSLAELVAYAEEFGIEEAARCFEPEEETRAQTDARMLALLPVMRQSVEDGMDPALRSMSGLTGGRAAMLKDAVTGGKTVGGALLGRAAARALAVAESNAAMGRIVAAPTAGACGILPGVLLTLAEEYGLDDRALLPGFYMAAAVGAIIAKRASISGAQGGCQAECGAASAMTAAAAVVLRGGSCRQAADAAGFALMNVMGLVCDPVGGLVEVPCVYRNVAGAAQALAAADLALAGIACPLPPDEIIDQMKAVGDMMPSALRETGQGGCAACPSALRMLKTETEPV